MTITINQPVSVPGCQHRSKLITVEVDGDEAQIRLYPDGGWELLRCCGVAEKIEDWTFITAITR